MPSGIRQAAAQADHEAGVVGWDALVHTAPDRFTIDATDPESTSLLHFTSGTTGRPKGRCTCMLPSSRTR